MPGLTADTSGNYKSKLPKIAGTGIVLGGAGYGAYNIHKLVKYGGGYKHVASSLKGAVKRGLKLSSKLDELINFGVAQVAHSPLGREMLKLRNKAHAEYVHASGRKKNALALKKLLEDNKHLMNFADPRPRNNLGEFSGSQEGVPDPNAMAKTYQQPQQPQRVPASQKKSALEGAGLVLAGGALGAIGGKAGNHAYDTVVKHVKNLAAMAKKGKVRP